MQLLQRRGASWRAQQGRLLAPSGRTLPKVGREDAGVHHGHGADLQGDAVEVPHVREQGLRACPRAPPSRRMSGQQDAGCRSRAFGWGGNITRERLHVRFAPTHNAPKQAHCVRVWTPRDVIAC